LSLAEQYLTKTSGLIKKFYKDYVWDIKTKDKKLYLTFDDGPNPEITPWVLDMLKQFNAKSTFFTIGRNAQMNPGLIERIIDDGHVLGNHTFDHINGWEVDNKVYFRDILKCAAVVNSKLFRPPYGKIKRSQAKVIKQRFNIIMWDVLSWDFKDSVTAEQCHQYVIDNSGPGSIVVFHDSLNAADNLRFTLPKILEYYANLDYQFVALTDSVFA
jgi:peptidoglycan-N-acetylglucosamine deacetylase